VRNLGGENADATGGLDLLLGLLAEEASLDDDRLVGEFALGEHLVDAVRGAVDHWSLALADKRLSDFLADERPEAVNVDGGAEVLVLLEVEVSHTDLTEVTRMKLVKVDAVMMLTTGETTSTGVLSVLTNSTVAVADLAAHLARLACVRRHVPKFLKAFVYSLRIGHVLGCRGESRTHRTGSK
jgi:hypothetical protein